MTGHSPFPHLPANLTAMKPAREKRGDDRAEHDHSGQGPAAMEPVQIGGVHKAKGFPVGALRIVAMEPTLDERDAPG
jgi:hypothetical protein